MARPDWWHSPWWLQVAHIASGGGDAVRKDDVRAVIALCPLAHDCHVSDADRFSVKKIAGREFPTIDARHTLWLKRYWHPEAYDEEFLQGIWKRRLPEPEPPPQFWRDMLFRNLGVMI